MTAWGIAGALLGGVLGLVAGYWIGMAVYGVLWMAGVVSAGSGKWPLLVFYAIVLLAAAGSGYGGWYAGRRYARGELGPPRDWTSFFARPRIRIWAAVAIAAGLLLLAALLLGRA